MQIASLKIAVIPLQVLAREKVQPSRNGVVVQAALRASVQLALSRQDPTQLIPRQACYLCAVPDHLCVRSQAAYRARTQLTLSHRTHTGSTLACNAIPGHLCIVSQAAFRAPAQRFERCLSTTPQLACLWICSMCCPLLTQRWPVCRVRALCEANIRADLPLELQRVAHSCLLQIAASEGGVNGAVEAALAAIGGTEVMQLR